MGATRVGDAAACAVACLRPEESLLLRLLAINSSSALWTGDSSPRTGRTDLLGRERATALDAALLVLEVLALLLEDRKSVVEGKSVLGV